MTTTQLTAHRDDPSRCPTDADLRGYDRAQSFAKMVAHSIAKRVEVGMTEQDAIRVTNDVFKENRIRHHWHMPVIGAGRGSMKFTSAGRFLRNLIGAGKRKVSDGDVLFIDIAPFFEGYPSDFTLTHLYGTNAILQAMIDSALSITRKISTTLREDMHAGKTWEWIKSEVEKLCPYELMPFPISPVAHRFSKVPTSWPKFPEIGTVHLFTMGAPVLMRSSTISMRGLWVIEPLLVDRKLNRAAKTEEVVFVSGSETVIFGEQPFVS